MSLFEGDTNAFHNPDDPMRLSDTGKVHRRNPAPRQRDQRRHQPVGQQLQTTYPRWRSADGRQLGTRQPIRARPSAVHPNKVSSRRVEIRSVDSANPHLAFSVPLAAGLKGITEDYELPDEAGDDVWALTPAERRAMGYKELPGSLAEALVAMEESNSSLKPSVSTSLTTSCVTSGPSGPTTAATSPLSNCATTCRCKDRSRRPATVSGGGVPCTGAPALSAILGLLDGSRRPISPRWAGQRESIDVLWSLSRAPDADLALRALIGCTMR